MTTSRSNHHPLISSHSPCTVLKGVGAKNAERLAKCGIHTIQDLLFHLPLRYLDRTRLTPIATLRAGDYAVIEGIIENVEVSYKGRKSLLCRIKDSTGMITLRFFHYTVAQQKSFTVGKSLKCFGEVRGWKRFELEIIHPEYRAINSEEQGIVEESLTPIYPTTEGLHQRSLRTLTTQALEWLEENPLLPDYLPEDVLEQYQLPSLQAALKYVHRPPPDARIDLLESKCHPTQQRLAFEELLAHQLSLQRLRLSIRHHQAPSLIKKNVLQSAFISQLPFKLTDAQSRVSEEISEDLTKSFPMLRLVQGDVGSGKTIVAALAALQAVENGFQVALMAPTELLAEQHYESFEKWLKPLNINVVSLTGKLQGKIRQSVLTSLAEGQASISIGTHALFQNDVKYRNLGLLIVDEQHRFGVHQRLALREKGVQNDVYPHQLIMTATPIPRTLAMTAYADLDHSVIDSLPPGRTPVKTVAISNDRRDSVLERIKGACESGKQAYWVCTLIEESELLQCQAAQKQAEDLSRALPNIRVGLVHGRLKSIEKEQVMLSFKKGELDLLVATTVIEVGVDVPNASLMVIENPERLGLAQLHQLRGRIGRGTVESFCVLLYQNPLSFIARERLSVMRESNDGFEIAQRDLELRGPGEVLGVRQTGLVNLRIADLSRDQKLIEKVHEVANKINGDSERINFIINRWLGSNTQYGSV